MKLLPLAIIGLAFSALGQSDSLSELCRSRDSIRFSENLKPFFEQWSGNRSHRVKIVQIGDSHIQMGYFSGGIQEEWRRTGDSVTNTAFWFPFALTGGFNPKGVKVDTSGSWKGEKMVGAIGDQRFSLTGHALVLGAPGVTTPFLDIQLPDPATECEVLVETNDAWTFTGAEKIVDKIKVRHISDNLSVISIRFDKPQQQFRLSVCAQEPAPKPLRVFGFRRVPEKEPAGLLFESYGSSGGKYSDYANKCQYGLEQLNYSAPDLLIISLGTNDAFGDYTVEEYHDLVAGFVGKIREQNKQINILLTTQPDTFFKEQKPPSDAIVFDVLTQIAREYNCALWDLASVMGGSGSIHPWFDEGLANTDLLHFTPKGYLFQAKLLVDALNQLGAR